MVTKKAKKKTAKKIRKKLVKKTSTKRPRQKKVANKSTGRKPAVPAKPSREVSVKVAAAKGRPMLMWVGKRPLNQVTAFPPQLVERHEAHNILGLVGNQTVEDRRKLFAGLREHWNAESWEGQPSPHGVAVPESGGLLLHGDNLECMAALLAAGYRGKVDLIYIDPPFDSGADYIRKVNLRGAKGGVKLEGEVYSLGEQIQYTDIWANDNYLQFMYERLLLLKELLKPDGFIYMHADAHRCHNLRMLMDEVFGLDAFRNQIAWKRTSAHAGANRYGAVTDFLLFYAMDPKEGTWNQVYQEITQEHKERHYRHEDERGLFALGELTAPGITNGPSGQAWRGFAIRSLGRHWAHSPEKLDRLDADGRIYWPEGGGWPRLKRYWEEHKGRACTDFWDDVDPINMVALEREDYPTQKPEALVGRMIAASCDIGDLVLNCFVGSGTTAAVAQKMGRRWIGCDINKGAIQTTAKRLRGIITEQIAQALAEKKELAATLFGPAQVKPAEPDKPKPCQFGFTVWRVNDYDLQVQHNEAVNIACEHIGVQRTRSDSFFDGIRGKKLVKVVPFDHPLSPVDLEELRRELDARPDEARNITLVCLGIELAARAWVDDWDRLRKGTGAVNRIEVIELRTDPKYGKFLIHEAARAKVKIARNKDRIHVTIEDFISPTIVERLRQQAGVVAPKIDDWRAMVDSVMIDTAYDGKVFNVVLADVPKKKSDLVSGMYDLPAPGDEETTVAVRITDMLGEEVVVIC